MSSSNLTNLCSRLLNCFSQGYKLPEDTPFPGIVSRISDLWHRTSKCKKIGFISAVILIATGSLAAILSSSSSYQNSIYSTKTPAQTTKPNNQKSNLNLVAVQPKNRISPSKATVLGKSGAITRKKTQTNVKDKTQIKAQTTTKTVVKDKPKISAQKTTKATIQDRKLDFISTSQEIKKPLCEAKLLEQKLTTVKYNTSQQTPSIITKSLQKDFQCFKLKMQIANDKYHKTSFVSVSSGSLYMLIKVLKHDSGLEPGESVITIKSEKNTCSIEKDNVPKELEPIIKEVSKCLGGFDSNKKRKKRHLETPTPRMIKV